MARRGALSVAFVCFSPEEQRLLSACSGTAVKCYMRLRARMDFATCIVGRFSGISYTMLREWSAQTIEKGSGEIEVQPSIKQVRTALAQLQRRGLIRRMSTEHLVFLMPLAAEGLERLKRTGHERGRVTGQRTGHEPGSVEPNDGAAFDDSHGPNGAGYGASPEGQNTPNGAHIGVYVNPIPLSGGVHDAEAVDAAVHHDAAAAINALAKSMSSAPPGAACSEPMSIAIGLVAQLRALGVRCQAQDPRLLAWVHERIDPQVLVRAVEVAKARRGHSVQTINVGLIDVIARDLLSQDARQREPTPAWWGSEQATFAKARALGLKPIRMETVAQLRQRIRDTLSDRRRAG